MMRHSRTIDVNGMRRRPAWGALAPVVAPAMASSIAGAATARTLADVQLPPHARLGDRQLALSSCGVRDTLWIEHDVAALYLPSGSPMTQAMRDANNPS